MRPFTGSSYANVTATLALVVALGGTSYAAIRLPAHSVGTLQLKPDAITSAKVRDGSLQRRDFRPGQLRVGKGAQGDRGPAGPRGPAGDASVAVVDYNRSDPIAVHAGATVAGSVACDAGMKVVGGGVYANPAGMTVESSVPQSADEWVVSMRNDSTAASAFQVYAICATASGVMDTD